jgi:hypothetical protein
MREMMQEAYTDLVIQGWHVAPDGTLYVCETT